MQLLQQISAPLGQNISLNLHLVSGLSTHLNLGGNAGV